MHNESCLPMSFHFVARAMSDLGKGVNNLGVSCQPRAMTLITKVCTTGYTRACEISGVMQGLPINKWRIAREWNPAVDTARV
jgi:hypothetical protein